MLECYDHGVHPQPIAMSCDAVASGEDPARESDSGCKYAPVDRSEDVDTSGEVMICVPVNNSVPPTMYHCPRCKEKMEKYAECWGHDDVIFARFYPIQLGVEIVLLLLVTVFAWSCMVVKIAWYSDMMTTMGVDDREDYLERFMFALSCGTAEFLTNIIVASVCCLITCWHFAWVSKYQHTMSVRAAVRPFKVHCGHCEEPSCVRCARLY